MPELSLSIYCSFNLDPSDVVIGLPLEMKNKNKTGHNKPMTHLKHL